MGETLANLELSDFELIELYFMQREAIASDLSVYLSILFAYLATTYFVGANLSRTESIGLSVVYSVFMLYVIFGITGTAAGFDATGIAIGFGGYNAPQIMSITLGSGWLLSILYINHYVSKDLLQVNLRHVNLFPVHLTRLQLIINTGENDVLTILTRI